MFLKLNYLNKNNKELFEKEPFDRHIKYKVDFNHEGAKGAQRMYFMVFLPLFAFVAFVVHIEF